MYYISKIRNITSNVKISSAIAGSLLGLAFVSYVITNALPIWSRFATEGYELTAGIWRVCETFGNNTVCFDFECSSSIDDSNLCRKLIAARAFITFACISSGISALCLFACIRIIDIANQMLLLTAKILVFICLVAGIIGVAVGITVTTEIATTNRLNIGSAAIIGIVAIIVNFFGAIITLLIK